MTGQRTGFAEAHSSFSLPGDGGAEPTVACKRSANQLNRFSAVATEHVSLSLSPTNGAGGFFWCPWLKLTNALVPSRVDGRH